MAQCAMVRTQKITAAAFDVMKTWILEHLFFGGPALITEWLLARWLPLMLLHYWPKLPDPELSVIVP